MVLETMPKIQMILCFQSEEYEAIHFTTENLSFLSEKAKEK